MKSKLWIGLTLLFLIGWFVPVQGQTLYSRSAKAMRCVTTNFNSALSSSDTNVQKALETLDDIAGSAGAWEIDSNNDLMPVTGAFTTVHWEVDVNDDLMPIN